MCFLKHRIFIVVFFLMQARSVKNGLVTRVKPTRV